jgi:hypothetical protein
MVSVLAGGISAFYYLITDTFSLILWKCCRFALTFTMEIPSGGQGFKNAISRE